MKYPLSKYKFFITGDRNGARQIVAVSTYGGKRVKGVAKCDPRDEFDAGKGKLLAAARCNEKISQKRFNRAKKKYEAALAQCRAADSYLYKMEEYLNDSEKDLCEANAEVKALLRDM